ncbi:phosphotransferase [Rhodococcus sp. IEGM 1381]|uniref:phosphotransferase n=1 Tax=Rhodococcus sp. IEGM 1381 TaxID=3047085 RepID=UPI0024B7A9C5|nr:phosphotransferase [Rhodococcus sp. IEGM 1381]MDI9894856.1 phosphotransferase [Rhodococcus sp. IEGM 1381]
MTTFRLSPAEMFPGLEALLSNRGLGVLEASDRHSFYGRNETLAGTTSLGDRLFAKRFLGDTDAERFQRTVLAESLCTEGFTTPRIVATDPENSLIVFEQIVEARSGLELSVEKGALTTDQARRCGELTAAIHNIAPASVTPHPHPTWRLIGITEVTLDRYLGATAAEIAVWQLLHADMELARSIDTLLRDEVGDVPIHGDLRFDQFLFSNDDTYILDLEDLQLGDRARDLGSMVGEWLYYAIADVPSLLAGESEDPNVTRELVSEVAAAQFENAKPLVRAFTDGYRGRVTHLDASNTDHCRPLPERVAAFAGWHLWDRMIALAGSMSSVSAVARAAAGIGRSLVLQPESHAHSLGIEGLIR